MAGLTRGGHEADRTDLLPLQDLSCTSRRTSPAGPKPLPRELDAPSLRAVLDVCPDAVLVLDEEGAPVHANSSWRSLFGKPAEPEIWLTEASATFFRQGILPLLSSVGWEGVLDARDGSGRQIPLWLRALAVRSAPGKGLIILSMRDHSEWHRNLTELREAKDEVQRTIQSRTKFLSHASHDLRQPLQAMGMFATVLAGRATDPEVSILVARIQDSIVALESLLGGLLDVSKLDSGLIEPVVEPMPVSRVLAGLDTEFAPAAEAAGLKFKIMPCQATVRSDPSILERILRHLVNNAIRFTPHGRVLVGCRKRAGVLSIQVWDTGIGIAAEEIGNIFKEFHQLTNSNRDRRQGLGLGLAIADRMARLLGLPLRVESWPGKGSLFQIDLPLADNSLRPPAQLALGMSRRGLTVLVLDDDTDVLEGLSMLLESWGHKVIAAGSAAELFAKAEAFGRVPDLVITDYRLQNGMTGSQVVSRLRTRLRSRIPAILLTGDTAPERLRQAKASGHDLLHKPVRADALAQAIEATLDRATVSLLPGI